MVAKNPSGGPQGQVGRPPSPCDQQIAGLTSPASTTAAHLQRVAARHQEPMDFDGTANGMARVAVDLLVTPWQQLAIVRNEILVAEADLVNALPVLNAAGFELRPKRDLNGQEMAPDEQECPLPFKRFVRDSGNEDETTRTAAVRVTVDSLRKRGIEAGPNHIMGFAMRGKDGAPPVVAQPLPAPSRRPAPGKDSPRIVVIDTGLSADVERRADYWLDGLAAGNDIDPLNVINRTQERTQYLDDAAGHGTFVAGVIRQLAADSRVTVRRALDSDGVGSEDVVACAINAALRGEPDIINLSLGQECLGDRPPVALRAAIEAVPEGTVIVAAAGNTPDIRPTWPAAFCRVVAVAALDRRGAPARRWSKRGRWVDVCAAGECVQSTFVEGTGDPARLGNAPGNFAPPSPAAMWTGTSFAAPRVSGLIAQEMARTRTSATVAYEQLLGNAPSVPGFGRSFG